MCYMIESVMVIVWTDLPRKKNFYRHTHKHTHATFLPHQMQKHHILLLADKHFRKKKITTAVNLRPLFTLELGRLTLISARCCGCQIQSLWILIFLFLLEPKYDLNTHGLSALWSGDSETLWWRRCPDVYWRDPDSIRSSPLRKSSLFC